LPGVESAGLANGIPIGNSYSMTAFDIKGRDEMSGFNTVTPKYFQTMQIPLLRGRSFTEADRAGAPRVAVIDEALARRFFPNENPVGQYLVSNSNVKASTAQIEIVGVVRGGQSTAPGELPGYLIYVPAGQPLFEQSFQRLILHVRTAHAPSDTFAAIRREVSALDPDMPLLNFMPLTEAIDTALLPQRLVAAVAGGFGLVGLALAGVGIFGLVSFTVAQRTHEIGVRMALGAQQGDVLRLVVGQGLRLALAGVAIGLSGAFVVTRLMASLLYGLSATDPLTFVGVPLLLVGVALVASYIPARRAMKVDPLVALRYE
ncbi:MAG: ABC transporter permease, partial [Pyrinomonadaceae bacterium]|nr:ABC transporter permease [Pyrinomonadaceae bacterium]